MKSEPVDIAKPNYTFHLDRNEYQNGNYSTLCGRSIRLDRNTRDHITVHNTYPYESLTQPKKVFCPTCKYMQVLNILDQANV